MIIKVPLSPIDTENQNLRGYYDIVSPVGYAVAAKFLNLSRIDMYPLFEIDEKMFHLVPTSFTLSECKMEGYTTDMSKIELVKALEDHVPQYSILRDRKKEIANLIIETQNISDGDIMDNIKYIHIIRDLKILLLNNE